MLPIETVLSLLLANMDSVEDDGGLCFWVSIDDDGGVIQSTTFEGLVEEVRTYLEAIVPAPKLLSECEEGKPYIVSDSHGWLDVCQRIGVAAASVSLKGTPSLLCELADAYTAIQPVEVNNET